MIHPHDRAAIAWAACLLVASVSAGGESPAARKIPGWGEVVDPSRDCKVTFEEARDRLTISVPGTPHVLSAEVAGMTLSAPRVVQAVDGDFKATVRAAGKLEPGSDRSTLYDPYHGEGLLVWKDGRNYVRLERAVAIIKGHAIPYLNYEHRQDGRLAFSHGFPTGDHPIHLKLERVDGTVRGWRSRDGSIWTELAGPSAPIGGRVEVGVVAINSSKHLLRAELERFRIDGHPTSKPEPSKDPATQITSKPAADPREAK